MVCANREVTGDYGNFDVSVVHEKAVLELDATFAYSGSKTATF